MAGKSVKRKVSHKNKAHKKEADDDYSDESNAGSSMTQNFVKNKKAKKKNSFKNVRKQQLLEANEEEDKSIRKLEVLLNLRKRKKKTLPTVFKNDGLDYLLGVIDRKEGETILSDDSMDLEEDLALVEGTKPTSILKNKVKPVKQQQETKPNCCRVAKQRTLKELLKEKGKSSSKEEDEHSEEEEESFEDENSETASDDDNDSNDAFDEENCSEDEDIQEKEDNTEQKNKPKVWEDIYGRLRDESGGVLKSSEAIKKYVPPKLRKESSVDENKREECLRIRRQLKGLLNRLSESNMQNICHQIEEMYMKNSRNDMNETLFALVSELVLTPTLTPPRLIMEQAMLIALLHANIGSEIGAYFLQHIVDKLGALFKEEGNYGEGKECNNMITFLSHLYNYKVTHSTLIFDVFQILVDSFQSKDIELIQLFLKNIGFVLRKDDPLKLKKLIFDIQGKATQFNKDQNDSRVRFMLETLTAIKNNNMYKIPDYDPSIMEHSKKFLRGLIRKGCSIQELAISYEDLLKVEERGRWWIVGSAWADSDNPSSKNPAAKELTVLPKNVVSEKILELARKQHMNTDIRKSIFCIIMTAEDFMDAFEKLLKLNLKNQQEREIIHVILHCALQEKNFNPYYAYLAEKLCSFSRKHQISLQFSLWDKFKELSKLEPYKMNNLSRLLSHLFNSGALPLSVLKVIHFSEMDKTMVRFFRQILLAVLLHDPEEACVRVFTRIAAADNLKLLRESLRFFMHHFVLRNQSKLKPEVATKLQERVKLAESALKSVKKIF
ncbi:hypothetical protein JTE90_014930 [Oedothorax gibbosus]|uniref:MI domain-containing protein n=1 Tax=Oedothorax gibbosus TaxID=931172 RepID=A0AAV6VP03_9ARAC|nr:hypothetical protein JTE90_014930 [Oedothorax gibbosus]